MYLYPDLPPYQRQHSYNRQALSGHQTPTIRTFSIEEWIGDPAAGIANQDGSQFLAGGVLPAIDPERFEEDFCWFLS